MKNSRVGERSRLIGGKPKFITAGMFQSERARGTFMTFAVSATFVIALALLGTLITVAVLAKGIYNDIVVEVQPSNLRSRIESIVPKELLEDYLEDVIGDVINSYLNTGFQRTLTQEMLVSRQTHDALVDVIKSKCQLLDYCYNSRNTSACLSFIVSTENWCKASYL
jgi:hypothetical protein